MNITYQDWVDNSNVLAYVVKVPGTRQTMETEISIGVYIAQNEVSVAIETGRIVEGVTSDCNLSRLADDSDFEGRPRSHFVRNEVASLHDAIVECDRLKAQFDARIEAMVEADRAAFERSLSGA